MVPLQNTVAGAYNNAVGGTTAAMGMNMAAQPMMASTAYATGTPATSTGYNAFTGMNPNGTAMAGFGAGNATGSGYTAANMDPVAHIQAGQFAGTDINPYMNPFLGQVVDQTSADMERARLIQQNQADDAAQRAGSFGGSRHGIANAETNRNFYDRLGATMGALRSQGYENAQRAAFQDIGNRMQADLANQGMDFNVGRANMDATNTARMTGANNRTQASMANAQREAQLAAMRMGAVNDARRFGATAANDTSRFNSNLGAQLSQYNAGSANDMSRFNANSYNTFGQNQFDNQMRAANQLGGLSTTGFNMARLMEGDMAAEDRMAEEAQQAIIDDARRQFDGYTSAGRIGLGDLQTGVNAAPNAGTETGTSNPGWLEPFSWVL